MSLRPLVLTFALLAAALPQAEAADGAHAKRLAKNLERAMAKRSDGDALADRLARTAKAWAYDKETERADLIRLKRAIKGIRALLAAPQAALTSEDFERVRALLCLVMGPEATRVIAQLHEAIFRELTRIFAAARAANSDPVNKRPVHLDGKDYEWVELQGRPILAERGAKLPTQRAKGHSPRSVPAGHRHVPGGLPPRPEESGRLEFADVAQGPGGKALDEALHGDVDPRNLDGLEPAFREKIVRILRRLQAKGWQPRVGSGRRTEAQQREKVRQGYSKTMKSWHLKGLAADIIDSRWGWGGEAANLDHAFWNDLGAAAAREGLTWGGNWTSFRDVAHVQDDGKTKPTAPPRRTVPRWGPQPR